MSLKASIIASVVWTVVVVIAGIAMIAYIGTHPVPGASTEQRTQMAGSATGTVAAIGYGAIWIPFAMVAGKKRREALAQQKARPKKKKVMVEEE